MISGTVPTIDASDIGNRTVLKVGITGIRTVPGTFLGIVEYNDIAAM